MKLHRLELRGIGPFASHFTINFDRLSVTGIYLLDGPTGSGKSTIIDAITWALYGSVAGGEDSTSDRMRSTHSDPGLESYIDLVFTVDAGTYRVRRTPSWTRAGNKNPTNVTAKLWKLYDGALESGDIEAGAILETKAAGTGVAVAELIGLTRKQFVQTIVLPQGKFAEFLRLNSSERTALLEQLFGTEVYRRVADNLAAMASAAGEGIKSTRQAFASSCENLLEDALPAGERRENLRSMTAGVTEPDDASALVEELEDLRKEATSTHEAAVDTQAMTTATLRRCQDALTLEKDLASRIAARSTLLERHDFLQKSESKILELELALQADQSARQLLARVETAEEAETASAEAREGVLRASDLAPDEASEGSLAILEKQLRDMNSLSGTLTELEKLEVGVAIARKEQLGEDKKLAEAQRALRESEEAAEPLPGRIAAVRKKQEAATTTFAGLAGAQAALRQTETRSHKVAELEELRASIAVAETSAGTKLQAFREAKEKHDALTEAWIESTAANLALELEDDQPCPVCGSLEHPSPARETNTLVTLEQVRAAEKVRRRQEAEVQKSQTSLQTLRATAAAMEKDLEGLSAVEAAQQLAAAQYAVASAEQSELEATKHARTIQSLTQQYDALNDQRMRLREEITSLTTRLAERTSRITSDEARLSEELHGFSSVQERKRFHESSLSTKNRELAAVRSWLQTRELSKVRQRELAEVLRYSTFATGKDVRTALLSPDCAELWRQQVAAHKQEVHDVTRDLAAPEIASLTGSEKPQLAVAQEAQKLAAQQDEAARTEAASAGAAVRQLTARLERVHEHLNSWKRAKASAGPVVRLAGLANGSSEYSFTKMTLPTYVLSQRFKLVVEQANQHLAVFSLGRYELVSTEEKEKGSRAQKVGLGLEIIDHMGDANGDVRRATKSLSGGETFYVSLSLALALADVVCSENGGIQLDTLMIDEGFGTLDENTRDQVMQVLTSLATNGRAVGVVSHVEELKKMIAEQIVVRPLPDGSSTLEVRA